MTETQFDVDVWARDFVRKAKTFPSMAHNERVIAGWFRSVIQAYSLGAAPPPAPSENIPPPMAFRDAFIAMATTYLALLAEIEQLKGENAELRREVAEWIKVGKDADAALTTLGKHKKVAESRLRTLEQWIREWQEAEDAWDALPAFITDTEAEAANAVSTRRKEARIKLRAPRAHRRREGVSADGKV